MITKAQVLRARRLGVSFVCATCPKWHEGADQGWDRCTGRTCCGPLGGGVFEEYSGLLTNYADYCFVCGGFPGLWVRVGASTTLFGVCDAHKSIVTEYKPVGGVPPLLQVQSLNGALVLAEELPVPRTLGQVLQEHAQEMYEEAVEKGLV